MNEFETLAITGNIKKNNVTCVWESEVMQYKIFVKLFRSLSSSFDMAHLKHSDFALMFFF